MKHDGMEFGIWFKERRETKGLTQDDASTHFGVAVQVVVKIEDGQFAWSVIAKMMPDLASKIRESFGDFPAEQELERLALSRYRPQALTSRLPANIEEELHEILRQNEREDCCESTRQDQNPEEPGKNYINVNLIEYPDNVCSRCRTEIFPADRRCPECRHPIDGSQ